MPDALFGIISPADQDSDLYPGDWTAKLMRQYPNGGLAGEYGMPITGISALTSVAEAVEDPKTVSYADKELDPMAATITANQWYSDSVLSSAYTTTASSGAFKWLKVSYATACLVVKNQMVTFKHPNYPLRGLRCKVLTVSRQADGAAAEQYSVLTLRLEQADTAITDLHTCTRMSVGAIRVGMGATLPDSRHREPTIYNTCVGTYADAVRALGSELSTTKRYDSDYTEDQRECQERHMINMEDEVLYSRYSISSVTADGDPDYSPMGIEQFIDTHNQTTTPGTTSDNGQVNYNLDTEFADKTWEEGGVDWIEKITSAYSLWAPQDVLVPCGKGVIDSLNKLARYHGTQLLTPTETTFGIRLKTYQAQHMNLHFLPSPLWSRDPSRDHRALFMVPKNIQRIYLKDRDTRFLPDVTFGKGGATSRDVKVEGWSTDRGWKLFLPKQWMMSDGWGTSNI